MMSGLYRHSSSRRGLARPVAVTLGCALAILYAQGSVFAALGIALEATRAGFGWSAQVAGSAFSVMVLACCVSAGLPARLIGWIGARTTMAGGMAVLAAGFALAALARTPFHLDVAMALTGTGFSLVGNAPALYLIAGWAKARTARHIGLYLTASALGNALVPPLAEASVSLDRTLWWRLCALAALVIGGVLVWLLRDPPAEGGETPGGEGGDLKVPWGWAFGGLVGAMVCAQTGMLTVSSVAPAQLATHGFGAGAVAAIFAAQGAVGVAATGLSGWLSGRLTAQRLLWIALAAQGLGTLGLAATGAGTTAGPGTALAVAFVLAYGFGMPMVTFAVTMVLVERFGRGPGTAGLGFIWTAAGLGAVGPWAAGISADRFSGHGPALVATGLLLLIVAGLGCADGKRWR